MGRGILLWLHLRHSAANYHSAVALLALADMSQPDSQRGETTAPDGAEKREHGVLNSAARVRQILGPAIAARLPERSFVAGWPVDGSIAAGSVVMTFGSLALG